MVREAFLRRWPLSKEGDGWVDGSGVWGSLLSAGEGSAQGGPEWEAWRVTRQRRRGQRPRSKRVGGLGLGHYLGSFAPSEVGIKGGGPDLGFSGIPLGAMLMTGP